MSRPASDQIGAYLSSHQHWLHEILLECLAPEADSLRAMDPFEKEQSLQQMLNLSQSEDCHYDNRSIGQSYSLWYLPQRIHDAARALRHLFTIDSNQDLNFLDLGAGTGATWIAVDLLERARVATGGARRQVQIAAVDSSAPMLNSGRRIWARYQTLTESLVKVTSKVASWTDFANTGPEIVIPEPVVVASFLFDHSDAARGSEVGRLLAEVLEQHRSRQAIIISANNKNHVRTVALSGLRRTAPFWTTSEIPPTNLWRGDLPEIKDFRIEALRGIREDWYRTMVERPSPSWAGSFPHVTVLQRADYQNLDVGRPAASMVLDEVQRKASTPDNRMTAIVGAAGSGKSRVLVERLLKTASEEIQRRSRITTKILVSTFNIQMLEQLVKWTKENWMLFPLLSSPTASGPGRTGDVTLRFDERILIRFINWDKVPTRLFGVSGQSLAEDTTHTFDRIICSWVQDGVEEFQKRRDWLAQRPWVTPTFLMAELHQVVYNLNVKSVEEYQKVHRVGRQRQTSQADREMLWSLMMQDRTTKLFVDQRIAMLDAIRRGTKPAETFHYVFIDEAQDFLPVEFREVIPALVDDACDIVIGLDATQALYTGSSFERPRQIAGINGQQRRWQTHELSGSYRLPIRICEALEPLAAQILSDRTKTRSTAEGAAQLDMSLPKQKGDDDPPEDRLTPSSMKSAITGIRPVILCPAHSDDLSKQLAEVLRTYCDFSTDQIGHVKLTYAEATPKEKSEMEMGLMRHGISGMVQIESVLKIKGLERPIVVWNTRMASSYARASELSEWIYTILTRTTGLLVIALSVHTPDEIKASVAALRRDRLLFWNKAAETRFEEWCTSH